MDGSSPPLRTIERAFEVIDVLWELNGTGPAELAKHMDLPKSTAHDYLRTLASTGYVVRQDGQYQIGHQFLAMGGQLKYRNRLFHIARPELKKIASETGELSNIGIEEDGKCVTLHAVKGTQSLNLGIHSGLITPMHSHATGKAILAHLPYEYVHDIIDSEGLEQMTKHTITDVETLIAELETIREDGYAVDWDQQVVGMGVVAVPILVDDDVLGAVTITCPTDRLKDRTYREELVRALREAANTIMINYQYGH